MEIMYPIVIVICIILGVAIFFINFNKKEKYTNGKKVANTKYIKETEYYKTKVKKYKIITNIVKGISVVCIVISSILVARPITVKTKGDSKYNRDIIISLDISTSECEVNLALVKKFKEILKDLEGDRIGIVIYNTAPVVYCPVTEDYDYIKEKLEFIEKQMQLVVDNYGRVPTSFDEEGTDTIIFWDGGTIANNEERGSSLVGDGLAGTILSFPDIKENTERTRIIIFATDNDVSGTEMISLEDACKLCNQYSVNLYAYCPTVEMNEYTSEEKIASYKKAVEQLAGGKFYTGNLEKMSTSLINEIKNTKTSLLKKSKKTLVTDHPEAFLVSIVILFTVLIIIEKRIRI